MLSKKTMEASLLFMLLLACTAGAKFHFASYYADHMVLQKEPSHAIIWGFGDPGSKVMLTLSQNHNIVTKMVQIEENCETWKIMLDPVAQGGPYTIEVHQYIKEEVSNLSLKDIYFGDVWICSGQSNMEMTVSQIFNASKEMEDASKYPLVRIFSTALIQSEVELQDLGGVNLQWSIPTARNLGHGDFSYFSAVCWLFGQYLFEKLKYPIGLIDTSWGGTPIEAWSSKKALNECGLLDYIERSPPLYLDAGPREVSVLWNAMIHPFINMTIQGVIWYQGEANTLMNTDMYNCTFPALIDDWRKAFHEGSDGQTNKQFPFGFVQLCTDQHVQISGKFPRIRWHQTADYGYVPNKRMSNTFMAVTIDLGDNESPYGSIHPRDKRTVAYRLHLGALAVAYGEKSIVFQGPYPRKVEVNETHRLLNITFEECVQLRHMDNKTFEVCCLNQGTCSWKPASIVSSSSYSVILQNPTCSDGIKGLRYAWSGWPCEYKQCPIYNLQELPAPPFITFSQNNPAWILL
ncbi:sialate O-acetylesterase [Pseudonaja textilis]|uniref:Sialic acid acetylesterase n=1 Tax=Pseudonaja textilis TaxID=8673 RepID=A0A670Z062_PSETE|nr:sialate O-acetylesterase [Pseudonaja textilis]